VSTPQVSAIVTAYNSGRFIHRSLRSLQTQTLRDIEIIVVDDGSTDGTAEVIDEYARRDPRVRVFHQPNSGAPGAGNRALAEARGEFVAILDHDDIALPDRLEKQAAYLSEHPAIGVVGGAIGVMDENERKVRVHRFPTSPTEVRYWLFRQPTINHSSSTVRREVALAVGGYRPNFDVIPDVDLFLRISDRADLATLPDIVVYYRMTPTGITSTQNPRQLLLNEVALELARSRVRGNPDKLPADLYLDENALGRLGLDDDQVDRLRGLYRAAALRAV
jgi:glycosyltransferase involved in cell wall biosynthesis